MKTCSAVCLLVVLMAICSVEAGVPCTDSSQCAADECCQIINIIIASKKRQLTPVGPNTSGTCEKYSQVGATCNSFDVMNGYCGCASGLTCQTFQVSTSAPVRAQLVQKRRPAPGYISLCSPAP